MKVVVIGASRNSGAAAMRALLSAGHDVTGLSRSAPQDPLDGARYVRGDVFDQAALATAVSGQDAVVVTLGISDNPIAVRLTRRASTPLDVRSRGTAAVVTAMRATGVRRLIVQSTYGIGDTYARLSPLFKVFFSTVLRPQVRDSARQEDIVRGSGLEWTLLRPVALTDADTDAPTIVRSDDTVAGMQVSRAQVARVAVAALFDPDAVHRTLSISA